MGLTKSFHFSNQQNQLANFAKAFAHPARIAIVQQIISNKSCVVGSLTDALPLSQSTISQHLKELKSVGIIKGEILKLQKSVAYTMTGKDAASIRTERWRYTRWGEDANGTNEELYDHEKDPEEHSNLLGNETYSKDLEELRQVFENTRASTRNGLSQ